MVASCQAWPPWAMAVLPDALILSAAEMNSSQLVGGCRPSSSNTALLAHTQLVEWTFTGAAIHLPSYFEKAWSAFGTTASQPSADATSFRSATTPSLPQS